MKRFVFAAIFAAVSFLSANAQMFDFAGNTRRFEVGVIAGKAGMNTPYEPRFAIGFDLVASGLYFDFIMVDAQHKYDRHFNDTKWHDDETFTINAGYQIPLLPWLRIMPVAGYAQSNDGWTDASTINVSGGENSSLYHDYVVIPESRKHYFNYGGGISIQPLKWFSLNAVYTRHAIYGGISLDILGITGVK